MPARTRARGCVCVCVCVKIHPRGSKYPNSRVSAPQIHTLNGFWTLKPYYLGTWTLLAYIYIYMCVDLSFWLPMYLSICLSV